MTVGAAAVVAVRAVPFHWFPKRCSSHRRRRCRGPRTSSRTRTRPTRGCVLVLPDGAAAVANDHDVPFQVSATAGPVPVCPTARQKVVPTHETEFRMSPVVAGASTLGTTVQVVPFHCSMRVPPPAPEFSVPTATQKVEVVQETSFSVLKPDPAARVEVRPVRGGHRRRAGDGAGGAEAAGARRPPARAPSGRRQQQGTGMRRMLPPPLFPTYPTSRVGGGSATRRGLCQATAVATSSQLSSSSGPPPPARNSTSRKPAASSQATHSGGVGNRTK